MLWSYFYWESLCLERTRSYTWKRVSRKWRGRVARIIRARERSRRKRKGEIARVRRSWRGSKLATRRRIREGRGVEGRREGRGERRRKGGGKGRRERGRDKWRRVRIKGRRRKWGRHGKPFR